MISFEEALWVLLSILVNGTVDGINPFSEGSLNIHLYTPCPVQGLALPLAYRSGALSRLVFIGE